MPEAVDPIKEFLSQPPEHGFADGIGAPAIAQSAPRRSFGQWLYHFLFEKESSDYSSISPRKTDGTRTRLFFFNGNGRR